MHAYHSNLLGKADNDTLERMKLDRSANRDPINAISLGLQRNEPVRWHHHGSKWTKVFFSSYFHFL